MPHTGDTLRSRRNRKGIARTRQTRSLLCRHPAGAVMRSVSGLQGRTNTEWHKGCFENTAQAWAVFLPKLGPPSIGSLFVYTSSNKEVIITTALRSPNSILCCRGAGKESYSMKASITSIVVGAIVLAGATTAQAQSLTDTEGFPRLPSVFRNCEEPLPRYCVRPPGLLWFGSIATIQHEHRAASFRGHRVGTAHPGRHLSAHGYSTFIPPPR